MHLTTILTSQQTSVGRTYRPLLAVQDYFAIMSQPAFEIAYVCSISDLIKRGAVSFTAASECYQTTNSVEWLIDTFIVPPAKQVR